MEGFLPQLVLILLLIVLFGFFNEKVTKLNYEISLMLFTIILMFVALVVSLLLGGNAERIIKEVQTININEFLMEGVICFMLFAGCCNIRLEDFEKNARQVTVLAIVATLLGALIYGFMFYGLSYLFGAKLSIPVCLMFGSIVAPTDPIAATGILKKFGLPKGISFLIEAESLLNDGVGAALFVFFSSMVVADSNVKFFEVMGKQLFGAVLVGVLVTLVCYIVFAKTKDNTRRITVSLLAVSASYLLCEIFGFSGPIASVVCGVLFAYLRRVEKKRKNIEIEAKEYTTFWEIADYLFNSVLYIMLGLSFLRILNMPHVLMTSIGAIICNTVARFVSLFISSNIMGEIPDGYDKLSFVKLLSWGALRGGLSIALAMSTQNMLDADTYHIVLGGTYAVVFFTTVVQGLSMKQVYNRISKKVG